MTLFTLHTPIAMTLEEIEIATNQDDTLKGLRAAIKLNKWHYDVVRPYKSIKDNLRLRQRVSSSVDHE